MTFKMPLVLCFDFKSFATNLTGKNDSPVNQ
jgi:hypothetical protein